MVKAIVQGLFLLFLHVISRRHAVKVLEHGGERGRVGEATGVHYFRNILSAFLQKSGRLL